jgi:hypothetical protein
MTELPDPMSALFPQGRPGQQLVAINPYGFLLRAPVSDALRHQVLTFRQVISREEVEQAFISAKHAR